ncbi:hypothetical protein C8F01DRAFT_1088624 [Mycena amicta]|nr:hypothetical protein C8F01DRAFT_1088624 [Mycena amicta]
MSESTLLLLPAHLAEVHLKPEWNPRGTSAKAQDGGEAKDGSEAPASSNPPLDEELKDQMRPPTPVSTTTSSKPNNSNPAESLMDLVQLSIGPPLETFETSEISQTSPAGIRVAVSEVSELAHEVSELAHSAVLLPDLAPEFQRSNLYQVYNLMHPSANLAPGVTPLSDDQRAKFDLTGVLHLTHVQAQQMQLWRNIDIGPSVPFLSPARLDTIIAWQAAVDAIPAWHRVPGVRWFRPVFLDSKQWARRDPRLAPFPLRSSEQLKQIRTWEEMIDALDAEDYSDTH